MRCRTNRMFQDSRTKSTSIAEQPQIVPHPRHWACHHSSANVWRLALSHAQHMFTVPPRTTTVAEKIHKISISQNNLILLNWGTSMELHKCITGAPIKIKRHRDGRNAWNTRTIWFSVAVITSKGRFSALVPMVASTHSVSGNILKTCCCCFDAQAAPRSSFVFLLRPRVS
jgi:hypothetical protein